MEDYDAVVVGAGPSGLSTAKLCAEKGLNILVLEEHLGIGEPVQCGEALISSALKDLNIRPEKEWAVNAPKGVVVHSPKGKRIEIKVPEGIESPVYVIERKVFEKRLSVLTANSGADILTGARVMNVNVKENVEVKYSHLGQVKEVRSRIVIGADGVQSNVARWCGIDVYRETEKFGVGAQFQMANIDIDPEVGEVYIGGERMHGGYWIIPKKDSFANVGLGIKSLNKDRAFRILRKFVENDQRLSKGSIIEVNSGLIPIGGAAENFVGDGVMLIGDAARQVNPLTGNGMVFGIKAGVIASEIAKKAIDQGDCSKETLREYEREWNKLFGKRFKVLNKVKEIFLNLKDEEIEEIFDAVEKSELPTELVLSIEDESRYSQIKLALQFLLKNPKLAWKFRGVIKAMR